MGIWIWIWGPILRLTGPGLCFVGGGGQDGFLVRSLVDGAGSYSVAHTAGLLPTELTGMWGWILLRSPHQGRGSSPAPAPTKQRRAQDAWGGARWGPRQLMHVGGPFHVMHTPWSRDGRRVGKGRWPSPPNPQPSCPLPPPPPPQPPACHLPVPSRAPSADNHYTGQRAGVSAPAHVSTGQSEGVLAPSGAELVKGARAGPQTHSTT